MPRFVRGQQDPEADDGGFASRDEHPELVGRVQAYSKPLVPDPESRLSVREQHLVGIVRPKAVRDVAWRRFG